MFKYPALDSFFTLEGEDYVLKDRVFENEILLSFDVATGEGKTFLTNVSFNKCKSEFGTILTGDRTYIKDVTFYNLHLGELIISPRVHLDNLKIKGSKPSKIYLFDNNIKMEALLARYGDQYTTPKDFYALDISEYSGQLHIRQFPVHLIKTNPERHLKIHAHEELTKGDIQDMGFKGSYIPLVLRSCLNDKYSYIEGLPRKKDKEYDNTLHDFEVLRKYYRQQGIEE